MRRRAALLLAIALLLGAWFALDLGRFTSLEVLKSSLDALAAWRDAAPLRAAGLFFVVYVAVAGLSLPGAAILTLAGGALFGRVWGTLLVSFASTLGATLAFWSARYLLREVVVARFGQRMDAIDAGMRRQGAAYLFGLRLIPVLPFFVVNLLMGLTAIPVRTFCLVSQLAMLPATLVYVNAGTALAGVHALRDILTPGLLFSFALLGLLPTLASRAMAAWQLRQRYARWRRPRHFDRNLVVIGAGAGGLVTAYIGAAVKASVTLVEAGSMGGDCLNSGCVPSKALIRTARLVQQMRHADRYGIAAHTPEVSMRAVMARVRAVIADIAPHDSVERYTGLGVEVLQGYARLVDPWTVEIAGTTGTRRLTTRSVVIATGASPVVPQLPGIEHSGCLTSDTLWEALADLERPPARVVVLGAGAIGCELAQALARLGSQVTLVELAERILVREDADIADLVRVALEGDGVNVRVACRAVRCTAQGDQRQVVVEHAGHEQVLDYDLLLCALGRRPRLTGFGLEELGIGTARSVSTNAWLETLYPNIYAVGDVTGPYQLTHAAAHQAWHAAVNALFGSFRRFKVDYSALPWTTFTDPEVAHVGLTEDQAMAQGIAFEVTRLAVDELDRAITDSARQGVIKVLTVPGRDRILGVTIVAEHAGDLLAEFVLAMRHGLGLGKILATVHSYPTFAEANRQVAGVWKREHAPHALLAWAERYHAWRRGRPA
ncbi:MAG: FAD-dependent oxidoreductase [Pseudomonadota bacterium]|nr:FAD-dependent oxidoreductase [Pseudomonadota bacterium]